MPLTKRPALRVFLTGLLAAVSLLALDVAPFHLVAYGQTAGPIPAVTIPAPVVTALAGQPPAVRTAIAGDTPSNCTALSGPVTAATGGTVGLQCSGGGTLAISAPGGAVGADGILSLVTVGDVQEALNDCTGADQLPILARQHFLSLWTAAGQGPSTDLGRPATVQVPIAPSILASAGGSTGRLLVVHALPDGAVSPLPATFNSNGTTATFQSSQLGDFYAVALPAGLPTPYRGTVGAVDAANHRFLLSGQDGQTTIQSDDRQGGTAIVHADGSPASFGDIANAPSVEVVGLPGPTGCSTSGNVVAIQITLGGSSDAVGHVSATSLLPAHLPSTGMGGMDQR